MENKICRNKNCMKPLPVGYKYKYCEACRNQQVQKMKNGLKFAVSSFVGLAACTIIPKVIVGKIKPKK